MAARTMRPIHILSVVGARPQFVKVACVAREIADQVEGRGGGLIKHSILHTGQHYDHSLSETFFEELSIPRPAINLEVGSGPHGLQTGQMLGGIEAILLDVAPDIVLVYGDTNSTLAGALAAAKLGVPVAHLEAGLRTFNRSMPEEINRVMADHVSSVLFCPTSLSIRNLEAEGLTNIIFGGERVSPGDLDEVALLMALTDRPLVVNVGDVMVDSFLFHRQRALERSSIVERLDLRPKDYILATVHRAETTDHPEVLGQLFETLSAIAGSMARVVCPLHPRTRRSLLDLGVLATSGELLLIEPVSYLDMLALEHHSQLILTDSGGVQKEAFLAGVPCVTLREETEWPETIECGWNRLAGVDRDRILKGVEEYGRELPPPAPPIYGDGTAARMIVDLLMALS